MKVLASVLSLMMVASAGAAVTSNTAHGPANNSLDGNMSASDLIHGQIGVELDPNGWHPANTNPADQAAALTDGVGALSGLTGLLNDFPAVGTPAKSMQYTLGAPSDITAIKIFTGNAGLDGRVFSTTVVNYSTDGGLSYNTLGYFQSDPSGTINSGGPYGSTQVDIFDDAASVMLSGVTDLIIDLYSVDNTGGEMRDPFDGVNPFTGVDDGLTAAFVSPLVYEIDVLPEPTSMSLLALGGLALIRRR